MPHTEAITIKTKYNYEEAIIWLQHHGTRIYGPNFKLYQQDKAVIYLLLCYFLKDELAAPELELDLRKGLLVTGPVGCGKTSLMNLMRFLVPSNQSFRIRSAREIAMAYSIHGYEVLMQYTRQSFNQFSRAPVTWCFDDLGTEPMVMYYGNDCNTMAQILLSRYDHYIYDGMLTHITTNLTSKEIENKYGYRVRSRIRELCNLISFTQDSIDKRK